MKINVDKCKIMHVGKNNPQYEYFMSGKKLMVVEEEKDIGVTIHSSLKPSKHCKRVADTANAVLRQLTKNFHFRDRHIFKKLYVLYIRQTTCRVRLTGMVTVERDGQVSD